MALIAAAPRLLVAHHVIFAVLVTMVVSGPATASITVEGYKGSLIPIDFQKLLPEVCFWRKEGFIPHGFESNCAVVVTSTVTRGDLFVDSTAGRTIDVPGDSHQYNVSAGEEPDRRNVVRRSPDNFFQYEQDTHMGGIDGVHHPDPNDPHEVWLTGHPFDAFVVTVRTLSSCCSYGIVSLTNLTVQINIKDHPPVAHPGRVVVPPGAKKVRLPPRSGYLATDKDMRLKNTKEIESVADIADPCCGWKIANDTCGQRFVENVGGSSPTTTWKFIATDSNGKKSDDATISVEPVPVDLRSAPRPYVPRSVTFCNPQSSTCRSPIVASDFLAPSVYVPCGGKIEMTFSLQGAGEGVTIASDHTGDEHQQLFNSLYYSPSSEVTPVLSAAVVAKGLAHPIAKRLATVATVTQSGFAEPNVASSNVATLQMLTTGPNHFSCRGSQLDTANFTDPVTGVSRVLHYLAGFDVRVAPDAGSPDFVYTGGRFAIRVEKFELKESSSTSVPAGLFFHNTLRRPLLVGDVVEAADVTFVSMSDWYRYQARRSKWSYGFAGEWQRAKPQQAAVFSVSLHNVVVCPTVRVAAPAQLHTTSAPPQAVLLHKTSTEPQDDGIDFETIRMWSLARPINFESESAFTVRSPVTSITQLYHTVINGFRATPARRVKDGDEITIAPNKGDAAPSSLVVMSSAHNRHRIVLGKRDDNNTLIVIDAQRRNYLPSLRLMGHMCQEPTSRVPIATPTKHSTSDVMPVIGVPNPTGQNRMGNTFKIKLKDGEVTTLWFSSFDDDFSTSQLALTQNPWLLRPTLAYPHPESSTTSFVSAAFDSMTHCVGINITGKAAVNAMVRDELRVAAMDRHGGISREIQIQFEVNGAATKRVVRSSSSSLSRIFVTLILTFAIGLAVGVIVLRFRGKGATLRRYAHPDVVADEEQARVADTVVDDEEIELDEEQMTVVNPSVASSA